MVSYCIKMLKFWQNWHCLKFEKIANILQTKIWQRAAHFIEVRSTHYHSKLHENPIWIQGGDSIWFFFSKSKLKLPKFEYLKIEKNLSISLKNLALPIIMPGYYPALQLDVDMNPRTEIDIFNLLIMSFLSILAQN